MEIINNKFRIIKDIEQNKMYSSYVVCDIGNNYDFLQLNILNMEYIPDNISEIFSKNFFKLNNINSSNIMKVYDFGLIYMVDNEERQYKQYYYTNQYVENPLYLSDIIKTLSFSDMLDLFIDICKAVNYLHLRGIAYGGININNIFVINRNNKKEIILKDVVSLELEKYDVWNSAKVSEIFKAPESIQEGINVKESDIYSLGILFLYLFTRGNIDSIKKNLWNIGQGNVSSSEFFNNYFFIKISEVLVKMLQYNPKERYTKISKVISDINIIFDKNYKSFNKNDVEKLNFNIQLLGKEYELNKIINAYNSMKESKPFNNCILVHGESGIGKTKLLKSLKHNLMLRGAKIYDSFILNSFNKNSNRAFSEILKKIISESKESILDKYESELIKFVPELGKKKTIIPTEALKGEKEKLRLLNRTVGFISEFSKNNPIVIIIDNFHLADEFTVDLVGYLVNLSNSNILVVLSYCDGECVLNKKFVECLSDLELKENSIKIYLQGLNHKETAQMIKEILSISNEPNELAKKVYERSDGNPLFIEEIIKNLYAQKVIFVNESDGEWKQEYLIDELPIPTNMEQALFNQIKGIPKETYEVLSAMSIFNNPMPLEIIGEILKDGVEDLKHKLDYLISMGVICSKIEDRGIVYDFYNKFLKNIIYEKNSSAYRYNKHMLAVNLLEKKHGDGGEYYIDEIIYHLERSGQNYKIVDYYLKNAYKMISLKNRTEALINLNKAINIYEDEVIDDNKLNIYYLIAEAYMEEENLKLAEYYYNLLKENANKVNNDKYTIDALIKICNIYYLRDNVEQQKNYIQEMEDILKVVDYKEGLINCNYRKAMLYCSLRKYEDSISTCIKIIELCGDCNLDIKGDAYNLIGYNYLEISEKELAMENFKISYVYCEKSRNVKGIVRSLTNSAVIFGDFYQDFQQALQYNIKALDMSKDKNLMSNQVNILNNMAACYFIMQDYDSSLEKLNEIQNIVKGHDFEIDLSYLYTLLAQANLKLCKFSESYDYYSKAITSMDGKLKSARNYVEVYMMAAAVNMVFGNIDLAEKYINMSMKNLEQDHSILRYHTEEYNQQIKIVKYQDNIDDKIMEELFVSTNKILSCLYNYDTKLEIILDICMRFIIIDKSEYGIKFFDKFESIYCEEMNTINKTKFMLIMGIKNKREPEGLRYLKEVLIMGKDNNLKCLYWRSCAAIGDYYHYNKEYFYSAVYYFQACEIIKELIESVPDEFKVSFVNGHKLTQYYDKFLNIKTKYLNKSKTEYTPMDVKCKEDIDKLLKSINYNEVIKNKNFIKAARNLYNSLLPQGVQSLNDVILMLQNDDYENLDILNKYIAYMTLAFRSLIIVNKPNHYKVVASISENYDMNEINLTLDKVKATKEMEFVKGKYNTNKKGYKESDGYIKNIICIPIMLGEDDKNKISKNRRKTNYDSRNILGYIYVESEKFLNNFSEDSIQQCYEIAKIIGVILEKINLKETASIDKLTGALTRKYLELSISETLEKTSGVDGQFSLIMLDLDRFKGINDSFGHQTGDFVLSTVCKLIKNNIRVTDTLGRYGGEEFIIILPSTSKDEAFEIADKLREVIEDANILGDRRKVTVSMGVVEYGVHGQWAKELIEKVDQALYAAKEGGRNQCKLWIPEYASSVKRINKLSGIISGNSVQDERNVLSIVEIVELIGEQTSREEKLYKFLGRIIEVTESEKGMIFLMENGEMGSSYAREIFNSDWIKPEDYNKNIITNIINSKEGIYGIDWDNIVEYDDITRVPDWKSILAIPIINLGEVKGILYLSVSSKKKEFNFEDYNFIKLLSQLIVPILSHR